MLGFSLPKLLFLILIVAVVWYGSRWVSRVNNIRKETRQRRESVERKDAAATTVDLVRNPKTGAYEPRKGNDAE